MILNCLSLRIIFTALLAIGLYPCSAKEREAQYPNGKISLSVQAKNNNPDDYGNPSFTINYINGNTTKNILSELLCGLSGSGCNHRPPQRRCLVYRWN